MPGTIITIGAEIHRSVAEQCRKVIRTGGVLVYPTDTFYALGVDPENAAAVRKLFSIKGRQEDRPILLLIADRTAVSRWAAGVNAAAERLMARFWPGPLTLVFTARTDVLPGLTGNSGKIGLRVPGNDTTRALLSAVGTALTGTSANRSGGPDPWSIDMVMDTVGGQVDLLLDGGPAEHRRPSTIIDVSRDAPEIIREGVIDADQLQ